VTDFVYAVVLIGVAVLWVFIGAFWVHVYRSDGTSSTPVGGLSTPRIVPPAGPSAAGGLSRTPDRDPPAPTHGAAQ
jgi:hypothetical protein